MSASYCRFCEMSFVGIYLNCPRCGKWLAPGEGKDIAPDDEYEIAERSVSTPLPDEIDPYIEAGNIVNDILIAHKDKWAGDDEIQDMLAEAFVKGVKFERENKDTPEGASLRPLSSNASFTPQTTPLPEQGGDELTVRATYYNFSCPNRVHVFALLDDTDTCIYCYVNDNPPLDRKQHELDARIDEIGRAEFWENRGLVFKSEDEYGNDVWLSYADRHDQLELERAKHTGGQS